MSPWGRVRSPAPEDDRAPSKGLAGSPPCPAPPHSHPVLSVAHILIVPPRTPMRVCLLAPHAGMLRAVVEKLSPETVVVSASAGK